jgi:hypothetical protein
MFHFPRLHEIASLTSKRPSIPPDAILPIVVKVKRGVDITEGIVHWHDHLQAAGHEDAHSLCFAIHKASLEMQTIERVFYPVIKVTIEGVSTRVIFMDYRYVP